MGSVVQEARHGCLKKLESPAAEASKYVYLVLVLEGLVYFSWFWPRERKQTRCVAIYLFTTMGAVLYAHKKSRGRQFSNSAFHASMSRGLVLGVTLFTSVTICRAKYRNGCHSMRYDVREIKN